MNRKTKSGEAEQRTNFYKKRRFRKLFKNKVMDNFLNKNSFESAAVPDVSPIIRMIVDAFAPAVAKRLAIRETDKPEPKCLNIDESLEYLNAMGFKMSKSNFYKITMDKLIPFSKYGRRLIFDKNDLDAWMDEQMSEKPDTISKSVAASARRKIK